MEEIWKVTFYSSLNGELPVKNFIDNLDEIAQGKVINTIRLLKMYGVQMGAPHARKIIGMDIWELRILGKDSIRIFYIAIQNKTFLLLHAFIKKSQKTPVKELKIAKERLREYRLKK